MVEKKRDRPKIAEGPWLKRPWDEVAHQTKPPDMRVPEMIKRPRPAPAPKPPSPLRQMVDREIFEGAWLEARRDALPAFKKKKREVQQTKGQRQRRGPDML